MEPAAITALTTLFGLGIKGWDAFKSQGVGTEELELLEDALDAAGKAVAGRQRPQPEAAAQHLALIVASFGRAFERHWVGTRGFSPGSRISRFFASKNDIERREEIKARIRFADLVPVVIGNRRPGPEELGELDILTASPLRTPYYRKLWHAFTSPSLDEPGKEPPLDMQPHTAREFERHFLLAYREALDSTAGQAVRGYLASLDAYRTVLTREILLADTAMWRERHVFGNVERQRYDQDELLPFLPLGRMYVEPDAALVQGEQRAAPAPVIDQLERFLDSADAPHIAVVKADFGSGKSLTARTLASRLAEMYLTSAEVSTELWLPVFVRCAEDFVGETFSLEDTVRRALKRQAESAGLSLPASDPAFSLPEQSQRTVYLLDGLDEVALGQRRLESLFERLREHATRRHRFIVFSRPGALPADDKLERMRVLELHPFRTRDEDGQPGGQVALWLAGWNQVLGRSQPIGARALAERELLDLAATPILLFMIAHTWDKHTATDAPPTHAAIYEMFFREVARGKHSLDREKHRPVFDAANELLERLREREIMAPGEPAEPADAMLWLLSRVAWEERRLARRAPDRHLDRRVVANLLADELELDKDVADTIEIGLLLTMQADLTAGRDHLFFGHKSLREFLVARYWADRLKHIIRGREREWDARARDLLGGRLLEYQDRSFDFLVQMLDGPSAYASGPLAWDDSLRKRLVDWAQECFHDESQLFAEPGHTELRHDQRAMLREAALAIGSSLTISTGIKLAEPKSLRSLLAWFWCTEEHPRIIAPKADLQSLQAPISATRISVKPISRVLSSSAPTSPAPFSTEPSWLMRSTMTRLAGQMASITGPQVRSI